MLSCCQRAAAQIRIKRLCKICPLVVSVVLFTALAKGLQALQTLDKRSAQNHPTWIGCTCSRLPPLSPLPSTQPHAGHPCAAVPPALLVRLRRTRGSAALVWRLSAGAGVGVQRFQSSARSASASGGSRIKQWAPPVRSQAEYPPTRVAERGTLWPLREVCRWRGEKKKAGCQGVSVLVSRHTPLLSVWILGTVPVPPNRKHKLAFRWSILDRVRADFLIKTLFELLSNEFSSGKNRKN